MKESLKITSLSDVISFSDESLQKLCIEGKEFLQIMVNPNSEETPTPWDCSFLIEDNKFILTGGVGPSGFGKCVIEVPLVKALIAYEVVIDIFNLSDDTVIKIKNYLDSNMVLYTEI
jgi:hypothetical protein